ncbi:MAG: hypothetical protein QXL96_11550 [Ignisphaera sp.]
MLKLLGWGFLSKGSNDYVTLVGFLELYHDIVQLVINNLWNLDEILSISALHKMIYSVLGKYSFRAHYVKQTYIYAKAIVKACKRNDSRNQF